MHSLWHTLTLPAQLSIEENAIVGPFSDPSSDCLFTPLLHQQVIRVEGKDAFSFLQGQLSCDLRDISTGMTRLGSHCNIKGHMMSLFRVIQPEESIFWLRGSQDLSEKALAQLKKYIIFSKATAEIDNDLVGLGIQGKAAASRLSQVLDLSEDSLPTQPGQALRLKQISCVCVGEQRYELWAEATALEPLLAKLQQTAAIMPLQQWLLSDIQAGIPDLRQETSEAFIPQMTNLQEFEGISFRKGCYTGQEIITRLQHRGQLKRPMYRARVQSNSLPLPGTPLHCEDKDGIGQVVLAAETGRAGEFELLAVILKARAETDTIMLPDQNPLQLLELPYSLDARLFESKR
ncbi:YgfZ/GcvT domain-containing protein [Nitrincola sp.]|uniref:CAF17-like 4Fe-4S cluster assembly/insertion protein YgfZ n=1 Tax=Nitrincola sp. TaxID=1926584 RepID=UPI003A8CCB6A